MVSAVITTCCREPEIVERALKSVFSQTYKEIEVLLVDDSPDTYPLRKDIEALAARYKTRYIKHEKNMGACAARNTGLQNAVGDYIAYLDDDDEWLPTKIERQIQLFTNDRIGLVFCGYLVINDVTGASHIGKQRFSRGNVYPALMAENFIGGVSFPLIRRSSLEAVGGFDVHMRAVQDLDTWLRLAKEYEVDYVQEPMVRYHVHAGEQISKNYANKIAGLQRLNEKNFDYLTRNPRLHAVRIMKLAPYYAKNGQIKTALLIWWKAVGIWPWNIAKNAQFLIRVLLKRV